MTKIHFENQSYLLNPGESVLDCLIREGVGVEYGCKSGGCQSCKMKVVSGAPTEQSQTGLDDAAKAQNYFLPCICMPEQDMEVARLGESAGGKLETEVLALDMLNHEVLRVRLHRPDNYDYFPGQFLNLYNPDGVGRAYSIASQAKDSFLELHIRHVPNGKVSGWANTRLKAGDRVSISQAAGECFYTPGNPEQPLLMIGTGTGLAPLLGILHDALRHNHTGEIHLYHGSSVINGLYMVEEMRAMADEVENFYYYPCVGQDSVPKGIFSARENQKALADRSDLSGWRVYLCGHEEMVTSTKEKTFLAGASLNDIYSDPFVPAAA